MGKKLFSKVFMLGVIFLVLCMGLYMVNGLVQDRQQYRAKVVDGFAKGYAGRQAIGTPRLLMVCKESWREHSDNNIVNRERIFTMEAAADEAKLVTISTIEPRTRGIYQVNTFQSKNTLQASWKKPSFTRTRQPREALAVDVVEMSASNSLGSIQTVCGQTDLVVQIQDLRGVRDLAIQVNDQTYAAETGLIENEKQGVTVRLNSAQVKASNDFKVSIDLGLVGIESLDIIPHAAKNTVQMQGNWPHPSFTGVLPDKRNITDKGFEATWSSSSYGIADKHSAAADRIGVAFIDPINAYTQTDRAIKYGLLFIVLTFVAVGLFEVTKKLQVHPVQYLLVGSAVTIFFLLLLSLSEHLSFPFAYVLAATACVGLLTFYASHILGGLLRGTPFGGLMVVLYGMIYVLLSLEQTALLIGSLALFGALTAVMVLTRKVNWYELGK